MFINYYEVLGVDRNATEGEIREVYYTLSKKYHPDRVLSGKENEILAKTNQNKTLSSSEEEQKKQIDNKLAKFREKFDEVKKAYEILSDPEQRSAHDKVLEEELRKLEPFYPRYVDLLKQGEFEEVKNLLEKGKISLDKILKVSAHERNYGNYTILYWAAKNNRLDIFEALKPYIKAKHIEKLLYHALDSDNTDIVKFILNNTIGLNDISSHIIISAKNSDLLFMLIKKGLDTKSPKAQENLLTLAVKFVEKNDVRSLDALLSEKIIKDIDAMNFLNNYYRGCEYGTILHAVVENQNIEMMKMFIKHQPDANKQFEEDGQTLLHSYAIGFKYKQSEDERTHTKNTMMMLVLLFNADLTIEDKKGNTPLDYLNDPQLKKELEDVVKLRDNINETYGATALNLIFQCLEKNSDKSIEDRVKYLLENPNQLANNTLHEKSRASSTISDSKNLFRIFVTIKRQRKEQPFAS